MLQKYTRKQRNNSLSKQHKSLLSSTKKLTQSKNFSNFSDSVFKSPTFYTDRSSKEATQGSLLLQSSVHLEQENIDTEYFQKFLNSEMDDGVKEEPLNQLEEQSSSKGAFQVINKYANINESGSLTSKQSIRREKYPKKNQWNGNVSIENPFAAVLKNQKLGKCLDQIFKRVKLVIWRKTILNLG